MISGLVNLLKPAGMTSHSAVGALRKILGTKKIGHTGTLDPMAAGVLCMCVDRATRAAEYLEADRKTYRCEMQLGVTTDTGDVWGSVLSRSGYDGIGADRITEVVESFKGVIEQYPPAYSAVRVAGRRLYEYARSGESVDVEPRRVTVYSISVKECDTSAGTVMFDIECSKGTYVRSVCTVAGEMLGCGAAMSFLVRTSNGNFKLEDAVTLEELSSAPQPERYIVPVEDMLTELGAIELNTEELNKYLNGGRLALRNVRMVRKNTLPRDSEFRDVFAVYGPGREFRGTSLFEREKKIFKADKVFFR